MSDYNISIDKFVLMIKTPTYMPEIQITADTSKSEGFHAQLFKIT